MPIPDVFERAIGVQSDTLDGDVPDEDADDIGAAITAYEDDLLASADEKR